MRALLRNIYLNLIGSISRPKAGIHIINAHFVTPNESEYKDVEIFEEFLKHLIKYGSFITLEEAIKKILNKDFPVDKVFIALTFDDGFEECYSIIAPLLEKYKTRGTFFVNANYINSDDVYQNEFNKRVKVYTKKPMSWKQIIELHKKGHTIGSHTLDHFNLAELSSEAQEFQLMENKRILEEFLKYNCEYFAWPYGQIHHFPKAALEKSLKYYCHIFSGTNYRQYFSMDSQVINRRHIEPFWSKNQINYFLSVKKTK